MTLFFGLPAAGLSSAGFQLLKFRNLRNLSHLSICWREKVVQDDKALDNVAVGVSLQTFRGDQCQDYGFARVRLVLKYFYAMVEFLFLGVVDFIFRAGEFHLAEIDGLVLTVYEQVDLGFL